MLPDINLFISPCQLWCCWLEIGWPRPLPTGPTHSTGGSGLSLFFLYPESILLSLRYFIWSSFQYLILTYILVTYFSIHACLAWNQLSSSYPTSYIAVGWRLDDAHLPRAHPFHRGRGWWVMTMTMAGGVEGGTRNLEHIYSQNIWMSGEKGEENPDSRTGSNDPLTLPGVYMFVVCIELLPWLRSLQ